MAELPLTVQLVSVAVPPLLCHAAAAPDGGVAADGAVGQRGRAARCSRPPPLTGGVAADGAVGQRQRAAVVAQAAAVAAAELPLTVQLVSVSRAVVDQAAAVRVEPLPPVIVSPEIDAVTPASTWNTRLARRR